MNILKRDKTFTQPVNWTAAFMAVFHVGAVAALFFFTLDAVVLTVVLTWVNSAMVADNCRELRFYLGP